MVDAQKVKHRGVEIVDVHAILHDVVAVFVGLAVRRARLHAAAGHPDSEAPRVMIAAEVAAGFVEALAVVGAAKLAAPDHERVFEHAAAGKILHQRRCRLVSLLALRPDAAGQAAVVIPVLMVELDKPHAPLGEPPGQHAVSRERARILGVGAVHLHDALRLVGEVRHVRHARLHAEGHLVVVDPGRDLGVGSAGELMFVQLPEAVEHLASVLRRHAGRIVDVKNGIGTGAKPHGLMLGRQEARAPEMRHQRLAALVLRDQDDERGEILMGVAEAVVEPGADARPARDLRATLHERHARTVVDALRMHRADEAEPVGDLGRVGQEFRERRTAFAVLGKLEWGACQGNRTLVA